jgi:hypothetical protein
VTNDIFQSYIHSMIPMIKLINCYNCTVHDNVNEIVFIITYHEKILYRIFFNLYENIINVLIQKYPKDNVLEFSSIYFDDIKNTVENFLLNNE